MKSKIILFLKKIWLLSLFFVLIIFLNKCGLERPLVAWDKPVFESASGTTFVFKTVHTHRDDSLREFMGYEVYYKLRNYDEEFSQSEINIIDANQLEANGFRRLFSEEAWASNPISLDIPLYKTEDSFEDKEYSITIDFSDIEKCLIYDGGYNVNREFRRSVSSADNHYKKFSQFVLTDADKNTLKLEGLVNGEKFQAKIALYVFAYGKSISSQSFYADIKSPPLYLSAITVEFIYNEN